MEEKTFSTKLFYNQLFLHDSFFNCATGELDVGKECCRFFGS